MRLKTDPTMIQAALVGYQQQLELIQTRIDQLRRKLGSRGVVAPEVKPAPRKHHVSPEGRARIAEAQRRRWAAVKKQQKTKAS